MQAACTDMPGFGQVVGQVLLQRELPHWMGLHLMPQCLDNQSMLRGAHLNNTAVVGVDVARLQ